MPCCLFFFSIALLLFSSIRSLLSELSLFKFLKKEKSYTLDFGMAPTRSKKKKPLEACQPRNSSAEL